MSDERQAKPGFWLGYLAPVGASQGGPTRLHAALCFARRPTDSASVRRTLASPALASLQAIAGDDELGRVCVTMAALVASLRLLAGIERGFVNTPALAHESGPSTSLLPIVFSADADASVRALIVGVQRSLSAAYSHQRQCAGLHAALDELGLAPASDVCVWAPAIHRQPEGSESSLTLALGREDDGRVWLEASSAGVLPRWFLSAALDTIEHLLAQLHVQLDVPLASLRCVSEAKLDELERFAIGPRAPLGDQTLVSRFAAIVAAHPDRPALRFGDREYSYAALAALVRGLTGHLHAELGVERGDVVAVMAGRSDWGVIGLLATLEAGAIYMPIAVHEPAQRRALLLRSGQAKCVLSWSRYLDELLECPELPAVALDLQLDAFAELGPAPANHPRAQDIAYLIHTSGSTGAPKPVEVSHASIVNVVEAHLEQLEMTPADRYLQFMAPSFDGSLLDIFSALLSGATLVMVDDALLTDPQRLLELVEREAISVTTMTPSYLSLLDPNRLARLRVLVSAGEAARPTTLRPLAGRLAVYNGYGPTEVAVNATLDRVDPTHDDARIPIGRPTRNKRVEVLGDDGHVVPPGFIGEIHVGGPALSDGYRGDPALTTDRFAVDPRGGRRYRTGDLGAWTPEGELLYVGRRGDQVKIDGFRVGVGEVRESLLAHPAVREAAIYPVDVGSGRTSLSAFFEPTTPTCELVPSLGEYGVYDAFVYDAMATDAMRVNGYRNALAGRVVDKVVLDPGTGSRLVLARHCLEAGARLVIAVERDPEAAAQARELLRREGLEHRVHLLVGDVSEVELPESPEVVVSALAGNLASSDGCIPLVEQLRARLGPDVEWIPARYHTGVIAYQLPEDHARGMSPNAAHYTRAVFAREGGPFDLRLCLRGFDRAQVLSTPGELEALRYDHGLSAAARREVELEVVRAGRFTGLVAWLEAYAGEQLVLDSREPTHHLPVYWPVGPSVGLEVERGDRIIFEFERQASADAVHPDYRVTGKLIRVGGERVGFDHRSPRRAPGFGGHALYRELLDERGEPRERAVADEPRLRRFLAERVPRHMIPARLTEVTRWPLTAHGKLDEQALLELEGERRAALAPGWIAPSTATQRTLAAVWSEVLGVAQLGLDDDFFVLGGDSIEAIRVVALARERGLALELADVVDQPKLRALAALLDARPRPATIDAPSSTAVELDPAERHALPPTCVDAHPASATQIQMAEAYEADGGTLGIYHCNAAWALAGAELDLDALTTALDDLVHAHCSLRAQLVRSSASGRLIHVVHRHEPRPTPVVTLDRAGDWPAAVAGFLNEDLRARFELDRFEPWSRLVICRGPGGACAVVISFHHAVLDGWSGSLLQAELLGRYSERRIGASRPPVVPIVGATRALVELEARDDPEAQRFFTDMFTTPPRPLEILANRPATGSARALARLDGDERLEFSRRASDAGVGRRAHSLSAWAQALAEFDPTTDVVTAVVSSARSDRLPEALKATGLFWRFVPVRLPASLSAAELQRRLHAAERHGAFGFARACDELGLAREHMPCFNFVRLEREQTAADGVTLREIAYTDRFEFPLTLTVSITDEAVLARLEWSRARIGDAEAERLLAHWRAFAAGT